MMKLLAGSVRNVSMSRALSTSHCPNRGVVRSDDARQIRCLRSRRPSSRPTITTATATLTGVTTERGPPTHACGADRDQPSWRSGRILDLLFFIVRGNSVTDSSLQGRCRGSCTRRALAACAMGSCSRGVGARQSLGDDRGHRAGPRRTHTLGDGRALNSPLPAKATGLEGQVSCRSMIGRTRPRARLSTLASMAGSRFGPAIAATIRAASAISSPPAAVT